MNPENQSLLVQATTNKRKKLWQLESRFHCSIIGTCLGLGELRKIWRKLHLSTNSPLSDYDLHRAFVSIAGERSEASRLLHRHLDKKYKETLRLVAKTNSEKTRQQLWKDAIQGGDVAGVYWALATNINISTALIEQVYGDVHMLSHVSGASVRIDMREFAALKQRHEDLVKQFREKIGCFQCQLKGKEDALCDMHKRLKVYEDQAESLEKVEPVSDEADLVSKQLQNQVEVLSVDVAKQRLRADRVEEKLFALRRHLFDFDRHKKRLEKQLADMTCERDALEENLSRLLSERCFNSCVTENKHHCSHRDLRGRCILYVGGRANQYNHFRTLVNEYNGRFIHHDGGNEDNQHRLSAILSRADVVVCPLDCVSHDAVRRVKRFCKNHAKPLALLPRSSLSAFAKGLDQVIN